MSVAFTEQAVRERRKTVTRRKGWEFVKPGDRLTLCRKVMGRSRVINGVRVTEPLVRICDVEVVSVRRERLGDMPESDVALEGYPEMSRADFINRFFVNFQGIFPDEHVTRIEWRYLDPQGIAAAREWAAGAGAAG